MGGRAAPVVGFLLSMGCVSSSENDLVDATLWKIRESQDPFAEYGEGRPECNPLGITEEAGVLEVQTDVCPSVTVWQPALSSSQGTQTLDILAYHSALYSDPASEGYMAIMIGDELLWDVLTDIPNEADVYAIQYPTFSKIREGDPIFFHVHNHGANSWKLAHIRLLP